MFWVYILECADGSFYTGHTDNLQLRVAQHERGVFADCYTYQRRPLKLVFQQQFASRHEAFQAERQIKPWSRAKKIALIKQDWHELSIQARSKRRQVE